MGLSDDQITLEINSTKGSRTVSFSRQEEGITWPVAQYLPPVHFLRHDTPYDYFEHTPKIPLDRMLCCLILWLQAHNIAGETIMPRPRKLRFVQGGPMSNIFKPRGIPARDLEEVVLPIEGLEAIRLSDLEKLDHETAATRMNVSRQTFGRILAEARQTLAEAIVMGKMIRIQGGSYTMSGVKKGRCKRCGRHRSNERG